MVWKAKTSLAELLRRRKQTLQEWMSQMGMATLDDVQAWCDTNDGVLDVPLPKGMKTVKVVVDRGVNVAEVKVALETIKDIRDLDMNYASKPNVETTSVVADKSDKKTKLTKKEESDPSSGTS